MILGEDGKGPSAQSIISVESFRSIDKISVGTFGDKKGLLCPSSAKNSLISPLFPPLNPLYHPGKMRENAEQFSHVLDIPPVFIEYDRKCSKMLLKSTHKKWLLCALLGKNSLISAFSPSFTLGDSVHLVADLVDRMNRERSNVCASVIWPIMSSPPHKTSAFQPRTIQ